MDRNTLGESCSLENYPSSHISLTTKNGLMDFTAPLDICTIEIESWDDLEDKIVSIFNSSFRNEDNHLYVIYQNKLFQQTYPSSSISICEDEEYNEYMYEEIVQTFNLPTQQEAEVVLLPDEKTWKKMWKYLKKVLKLRKR